MVRTIIQLTESENAKLTRLAKRKGWSRAETMRHALSLLSDDPHTPKRHWGLLRGSSSDLRQNYRDSDR